MLGGPQSTDINWKNNGENSLGAENFHKIIRSKYFQHKLPLDHHILSDIWAAIKMFIRKKLFEIRQFLTLPRHYTDSLTGLSLQCMTLAVLIIAGWGPLTGPANHPLPARSVITIKLSTSQFAMISWPRTDCNTNTSLQSSYRAKITLFLRLNQDWTRECFYRPLLKLHVRLRLGESS